VQIRKDVQDAILRKIQQSESNFDRASLEAIYGKDVVERHLLDLIEVHLVNGRVMKGVSPPRTEIMVLGLTAAGQRRLGIDESGGGLASE
jgi:hypothetical protein